MNATIDRIADGQWKVMVGDVVVSLSRPSCSSLLHWRELSHVPVHSSMPPNDDIDLSGPDGSSANPYLGRTCPTRRTNSSSTARHVRRRCLPGRRSSFVLEFYLWPGRVTG